MFRSKMMLPILAVIVGVAASAFTTVSSQSHDAGTWYSYKTSAPQTPSARQVATNYQRSSEPPCNSSNNECAVELNHDSGITPDFTGVNFDSQGFPIVDQDIILANKKKE